MGPIWEWPTGALVGAVIFLLLAFIFICFVIKGSEGDK